MEVVLTARKRFYVQRIVPSVRLLRCVAFRMKNIFHEFLKSIVMCLRQRSEIRTQSSIPMIGDQADEARLLP